MNVNRIAKFACIITLFLTCSWTAEKEFKNPLLMNGPDPWVAYHNKTYYVTHSAGRGLKLYRTSSMSKLGEAESKMVWMAPPTGMNSKEVWAPEIHRINNKWYFYYAADDGKNDNHRMWVVENSSEDPFEGTWVDKGKLELPGDRWAIDGTAFEHRGQLYFMWSGWEGATNVSQNIYLVKMKNPWTPEGDRVLLSKPELSWEVKGSSKGLPVVNEGPQFLKHGNKVFVIYSASGCWTDDYTLGVLSADRKADLMNPSSWTKSQQPVFMKNPEGKALVPVIMVSSNHRMEKKTGSSITQTRPQVRDAEILAPRACRSLHGIATTCPCLVCR